MPYLLAVLGLMIGSPAPLAGCTADLTVLVHGFRSEQGQAGAALFAAPPGFPLGVEKAHRKDLVPIVNRTAKVTFSGVPSGEYALAVMHDENGNEKLDRNWVGKPTEGYGVSNDAPPRRFGAPEYGEARFDAACGANTLEVRLRY
jgi:uncharacterized protein (DUF2141 family)